MEDLEFLDELKRKKVDEAREAEESAKAAATKKTNTTAQIVPIPLLLQIKQSHLPKSNKKHHQTKE